jgi:hypothetical protein
MIQTFKEFTFFILVVLAFSGIGYLLQPNMMKVQKKYASKQLEILKNIL